MKRTLKRSENPKSAAMHIQYQVSVVNKPLSCRRVFPTVGWEPLVGCDKRTKKLESVILGVFN